MPKTRTIQTNTSSTDVVTLAHGEYLNALEDVDRLSNDAKTASHKRELAEDGLEMAATHATNLDGIPQSENLIRTARKLNDALKEEKSAQVALKDAKKELRSARNAWNMVK
jgi:hypothetical protein